MNKNKQCKLTKKRKKAIYNRLKEGYTVDQIKNAILGCCKSAFHMGDNDYAKRYDDIELICRNQKKLERFIKLYHRSTSPYSRITQRNINNTRGNW